MKIWSIRVKKGFLRRELFTLSIQYPEKRLIKFQGRLFNMKFRALDRERLSAAKGILVKLNRFDFKDTT